ncbi:hypothetical protein K437DRAFT_139704 [Tilletiaria anomala UBC 951]|uniref:SET domain-containing protein n=1 Tax=Tilletiaria anomala (strain ATCC 24038 / CBS 436.72 / UBC 951) TaxID=1037660 RepID=A0A066VVD3_TILAU|nr:uncharacterized protein K437DRAFT_139704 [Tilletiaria anomala UBC 951]KDN44243.1 hypothetical protein K437DRAFT_139704 [Tilletiaria anomala UBC 951]
MEDLLRSLRGLGLQAPNSEQLLELLDQEPESQRRLAQLLALQSKDDNDDSLLTKDILDAGVQALFENFARALQKEKELFKSELNALAVPKPIKTVPRKALLARQAAEIKRMQEAWAASEGYHPRLIFDGGDTYHSTTPLSQLKALSVRNLKAPARHVGSFLLCRVVSCLNLYVGCTFIVEDSAGDAVPVSVSHFTSNLKLSIAELSSLLPIGTALAIREPYLSLNHASRAGPASSKSVIGIRVDTPTDIKVLHDDDALLSDVTWKESLTLPAASPSLKHLKWLQRFSGKSYHSSDADSAAAKDAAHVFRAQGRTGAAYRVVSAQQAVNSSADAELEELQCQLLFDAGAYPEAFEAMSSTTSPSSAMATLKHKSQGLMTEAGQGCSSARVASFYFTSQLSDKARLTTADFVGPVTVRDIPGAGRGLVLTREVEPGELLLCCRAIGGSFAADEGCSGIPVIRLNLEDGLISTTTQILAATNIIHCLIDRPNLALPFLGLTAGPKLPVSKWAKQPYPLRWSNVPPSALDEKDELDIDAAYVDGVLRFNAFGPGQISRKSDPKAKISGGASSNAAASIPEMTGELGRATMPHPLPAILNHSCLPNVSSVFFGDVVTTRALHRLPTGTEIMHQYVKGEQPYAVRSAQLSKHEFKCGCTLCVLDRGDGDENVKKRQAIMGGTLPALLERSRLVMKGQGGPEKEVDVDALHDAMRSLQALVQDLQHTYSSTRGYLRPELMHVHVEIAKICNCAGSLEQSIQVSERNAMLDEFCPGFELADIFWQSYLDALAVVGVQPRQGPSASSHTSSLTCDKMPDLHFDDALACMLSIAKLYLRMEDTESAVAWTRTAFWAHECMINGGVEVFMDRWGQDETYADVLHVWQTA